LRDGAALAERVASMRQTTPSAEDVRQKAMELMSEAIGTTAASALVEQVLRIESVTDMRALRPLLRGRA
jgi:hypothetical protein